MQTIPRIAFLAAACLCAAAAAVGQERGAGGKDSLIDPRLPHYVPEVTGLEGQLDFVGSDTMINLNNLWGEQFRKFNPDVTIQVEGKGSSTAPPALIEGTSDFGPMSRPMKSGEIDAFVERYGYEPTRVRACLDALAVFVHKDNPVAERGLTMDEVDAIFSKTRKLGYPEDITRWGQLGLTGEWADAPIHLFGRNSASGTYGFFKKHALLKGDFKDAVKEQPGSASVVQSVGSDPFAIGYSGIGYRTSSVRVVPLSEDGEDYYEADLENVVDGDYPLGRFLNLYVNLPPNGELDPMRREFLRLVFSREGQEQVLKAGYLPITADVAAEECARLGIPFEFADPEKEEGRWDPAGAKRSD